MIMKNLNINTKNYKNIAFNNSISAIIIAFYYSIKFFPAIVIMNFPTKNFKFRNFFQALQSKFQNNHHKGECYEFTNFG